MSKKILAVPAASAYEGIGTNPGSPFAAMQLAAGDAALAACRNAPQSQSAAAYRVLLLALWAGCRSNETNRYL